MVIWGWPSPLLLRTLTVSRGDDNRNINHIMQLAMSLALDLRLNKPLIDEGGHKFDRIVECGLGPITEAHTLEQRRAVLACFFLSSLLVYPSGLRCCFLANNRLKLKRLSTFFARIDPLQWTPQVSFYAASSYATPIWRPRVFFPRHCFDVRKRCYAESCIDG